MDIWKALTLAAVMAIRDDYRDMEEQTKYETRKQQQYFQKCIEDFADAVARIANTVYEVCKRANANVCPQEINIGVGIIPVYIFMKVLKAQVGKPSTNQTTVMDLYFKTFDVGFTKNEFIDSLHSNNSARQKMKALVGISETFVGVFWIALFKAMYATKSDEETLKKIMNDFTTAMIRFAVLGNVQEYVITNICEKFISAIQTQIIECRKLPESQIDYCGESSTDEHLKRMSDIAFGLYNISGDSDGPEMKDIFPHFLAGILHGFIDKSSMSTTEKGKLLEKLMRRFSIDVSLGEMRFSGPMLFHASTERNDFQDLLRKMQGVVVDMPPIMFQSIMLYSIQSGRNDDPMTFMYACSGFLLGIEKEVAEEYPFFGFGNIAGPFINDEFSKIRD